MTVRQKAAAVLIASIVLFIGAVGVSRVPYVHRHFGRWFPWGFTREADCSEAALRRIDDGDLEGGLRRLTGCPGRGASENAAAARQIQATADALATIAGPEGVAIPLLNGPSPVLSQDAAKRLLAALSAVPVDSSPVAYLKNAAAFQRSILAWYAGDAAASRESARIAADGRVLPDYALHQFALASLRLGDTDAVMDAAERMRKQFPESLMAGEMNLLLAKALFNKGKKTEAVAACRETLDGKYAPMTRGRAAFLAAEIARSSGDMDAYADALLDIARRYPDADIDMNLGDLMDKSENKRAPRKFPAEDSVALGRYFLEKNNLFRASKVLKPALKTYSKDAGVLYLAAQIEIERGKPKDALPLLTAAKRTAKDDLPRQICLREGEALWGAGKRKDGAAKMKSCAEDFDTFQYEALRGLARMQSVDDIDGQMETLHRIVIEFPRLEGNDLHLRQLARYHYLNRKYDEAAVLYKNLVVYFPQSRFVDDALFWRGKMALENGAADEAKEYFGKLRELYPYSYFASRSEALLPEAKAENPAAAASPDDSAPMDDRLRNGLALALLGFRSAAEAELKATTDNPDATAVAMSRLYRATGAIGASVKALEIRALASAPFYLRVIVDPELRELMYPATLHIDPARNAARQFGVPLPLILGVIRQESRFDSTAVSSSNALGLMQVIPSTGQWIAGKLGESGFASSALFRPETNIRYGAWYLKYLNDKFGGDPVLITAGYNGGPGNVTRWSASFGTADIDRFLESIPRDETRDYVKKVLHNYEVYSAILGQ